MTVFMIALVVVASTNELRADERTHASALEESLREAETAFAKTMEDRDLEAFASFIEDDAIFSGPGGVLRGKTEIVTEWSRFFETPQAPFSWKPERVHVRESDSIGGTTGPVFDPGGKMIGQFVSTWRRDRSGKWKILLDLAPDCRQDSAQ